MTTGIFFSWEFSQDVQRCERLGWDLAPMWEATFILNAGKKLPVRFDDHPLDGIWSDHRTYQIGENRLVLYTWHTPSGSEKSSVLAYVRMGSREDLFR